MTDVDVICSVDEYNDFIPLHGALLMTCSQSRELGPRGICARGRRTHSKRSSSLSNCISPKLVTLHHARRQIRSKARSYSTIDAMWVLWLSDFVDISHLFCRSQFMLMTRISISNLLIMSGSASIERISKSLREPFHPLIYRHMERSSDSANPRKLSICCFSISILWRSLIFLCSPSAHSPHLWKQPRNTRFSQPFLSVKSTCSLSHTLALLYKWII